MPMPKQVNSPYTNVDWVTPRHIIEALGEFDTDPCCPPNMPWRTAREMYTPSLDGFHLPWPGRVWLNPPFQGAAQWVKRLAEHGNGIALLPCATDTGYFCDHVFGRAHGILFLKGRVTFYFPDGTVAANNCPRPCCLVAYGMNNFAALATSGLAGALCVEVRR